MLRLILYHENQQLAVELKDGVYRMGRQKPADIVIPDTTVSSAHAELQVLGTECLLRDMGSRNGTFVNGKQIHAAVPVKAGDDIRLGAVRIAIERPQEVKPMPSQPVSVPGPTARMEAVKSATSKVPWTARYWIAGAEAILFLLLLFFVVLFYSESVASSVRLTNRYKSLAAQYIQVLQDPSVTRVAPPVTDESLKPPIMVANANGRILYPLFSDGTAPKSPLIDPASGKIRPAVRWGLADLPAKPEDSPLRSYPVSSAGGQTLGYVVARSAADPESALGKNLAMLVVAGLIALILLYFLLSPVHRMIRGQIEAVRLKISPLFNGFTDELPKGGKVRDVDNLAAEIEKFAAQRGDADRAAVRATGKVRGAEYGPMLTDLLDSARVPFCFVNSDFKILTLSPWMRKLDEFARATVDSSIFDTGMTAIQSKQLVQTIAEAKKSGEARVPLTFSSGRGPVDHEVAVKMFNDPARGQIYGVVFRPLSG